jgi:hypothetical protein
MPKKSGFVKKIYSSLPLPSLSSRKGKGNLYDPLARERWNFFYEVLKERE